MDVDAIVVEENEDLISFFALQPHEFAWKDGRVREIQERRAAMSNLLFFDILLQLGGIEEAAKLYPPKNVKALQRLLDAVDSATFDSMKRDCLIYYLLKWQLDGREQSYADEKCISPHYVALADAYWHLDAGLELGKAIALFSDARIVKEYPSKILETLALADNSGPLIRKFVRTCRPALREQPDLERYLVALAEYSIIEAWQYQRNFAGTTDIRRGLIQKLVSWTLTPHLRRDPLKQLISLPFSEYEDSVVRKFATDPPEDFPPKSTSVLRDMVCVRLIQNCKYVDAVKLDRQFYGTAPTGGAGAAKGTWAAERKRVIEGVLSIMPPTERSQLERELDGIGGAPGTSPIVSGSSLAASGSGRSWANVNGSMSTDLAMSWEDVGGSSLSRRKSLNKPPSRPRQSQAQRAPLANGTIPPTLFTPGASTSAASPRAPIPLSAHPTLVSQTSGPTTASASSSHPSLVGQSSAALNGNAQSTPTRANAISSSIVANGSPLVVNGTSGAQKKNAFVARNAFFNPPEMTEREQEVRLNGSSSVRTNGKAPSTNGDTHRPSSPAKARTPPPPAEPDSQESSPAKTSPLATSPPEEQHFIDVDQDSISVISEGNDQSPTSEQENDLGFSIFGGPSSSSVYRSPPKKNTLPEKRGRITRAASEQEAKKLPGAFISDDEDADFGSHTLRNGRSTVQQSSHAPNKRNTRKRAASPDESAETIRVNIPGTLFEDEEEGDRSHDQGDETGEEADTVPPLPVSSGRGAGRISAGGSKRGAGKSRASRSRGSSVEPSDLGEDSNKPVRRSTRLSSTSGPSSPVEKQKKSTTNGRPRKSTRTAKDGATATGRGATKRR